MVTFTGLLAMSAEVRPAYARRGRRPVERHTGRPGFFSGFYLRTLFRVAVIVAVYLHKLFGLPSAAQFAF